MTPAAAATKVTRAEVLVHRAAAHDLVNPVSDPLACSVLTTGVQDYPIGATAHLALRPRTRHFGLGDLGNLLDSGRLALVHSIRGAAHLHDATALDRLAAALRPDDAKDIAPAQGGPFWAELADSRVSPDQAIDQVAAVMRETMSDGVVRTKGELSGQISPHIDPRLRPWCPGCAAHQVQDLLFRFATLQAGLRIDRGSPSDPISYRAVPTPAGDGSTADRAASRLGLLRRFLRLSGPATPTQLAGWLGISAAAARRWWRGVADELIPVDVAGHRCWAPAEVLDALESASLNDHHAVLLPPYDPLTEIADRRLLVGDDAERRQVWRSAANPGIVLLGGEIVGTWRRQTSRQQTVVSTTLFREPRRAQTAAIESAREELVHFINAAPR